MDEHALRERVRALATAQPDVEAALAAFRRERARRGRGRKVLAVAASIVVVIAASLGAFAFARDDGAPRPIVTGPGETTTTSTSAAPARPLPDVVGLDYRDATAQLDQYVSDGGRVRWTIDIVTPGRFGEVLGMSPPVGERLAPGQDIVIRVAASAEELGLGSQAEPPTLVATTWRDDPVPGLTPGIEDGTSAPECTVDGEALPAVRFLRGEVVGCRVANTVWLDQMPEAFAPVGTMPDVIGLRAAEASAELARLLPAAVVSPTSDVVEFRPDDPLGSVVATVPAVGQHVTRIYGVQLVTAPPLTRDAQTVRAYFPSSVGNSCRSSTAARRDVPGGDAIEAAFRSLLAGPNPDTDGTDVSWFEGSTTEALRSVDVRDGVLTVDLAPLRDWLGGIATTSCAGGAFQSAVQATAFQFAGVEAVEITQDGSCAAATAYFEGSGCNRTTRSDWLAGR
jgi:hypothetical protein